MTNGIGRSEHGGLARKVRLMLAVAAAALLALPLHARAQPCPDGDNDGICDADDPCTRDALTTIESPKLKVRGLHTPPGDDAFKFTGNLASLPDAGSGGYPPVDGVRVLVTTASGEPVLDTLIPGGAYDPTARVGWKVVHDVGALVDRYVYLDRSGSPIDGIWRIAIFRRLDSGAVYTVSVGGKKGNYAFSTTDIPLRFTFVIDPPTATNGDCAETDSPPFACEVMSGGKVVSCR